MDLLNLNHDDFVDNGTGNSFSDPDMFRPNPAKGKEGTYKAVLRYLPWWKNPKESKYKKYSAILTHPVTREKLFVDCPSTVKGKFSILWTIDRLLRDRKNEKRDLDLVDEIGANFNRYYNYHSPVFVVKDPQVRENEKKIFIYNYGYTIEQIQQKLLKPEEIDDDMISEKINPFSLTDGKDFLLVARKKSKHGKDYGSSKFLDKVTPFRFPTGKTEDGEIISHVCKKVSDPAEAKKENAAILKYLKENTPDMEKYYFKDWTDKTYKDVAIYLKAIIPYKDFMNEILDASKDEKMNEILRDLYFKKEETTAAPKPESKPEPVEEAVAEESIEDTDIIDDVEVDSTPEPKAKAESKVEAESADGAEMSDEFDDILKDL